jgi:hypothetical protein
MIGIWFALDVANWLKIPNLMQLKRLLNYNHPCQLILINTLKGNRSHHIQKRLGVRMKRICLYLLLSVICSSISTVAFAANPKADNPPNIKSSANSEVGRYQLMLGKQQVVTNEGRSIVVDAAYVIDTITGMLYVCNSAMDKDGNVSRACSAYSFGQSSIPK